MAAIGAQCHTLLLMMLRLASGLLEERIHFLALLDDVAVILLVLMRSPMYFCRNLLLLSSLSCSSLTASMRLNIMSSDSWRAFACLVTVPRASATMPQE